MKLFLSYSTRDTELVEALHTDLERLGHEVWRDVKILGGQDWWDRICLELRACDAVVFALTPGSVLSRPCQSELTYADALQRPVLPVMLLETPIAAAPVEVQSRNVVPYLYADHEALMALLAALGGVSVGVPLPAELPPQPVAPMGELPGVTARVKAPEPLGADEQHELVQALRELCEGGELEALEVVRLMRSRELLGAVERDLDELLDTHSGSSSGNGRDPQLVMAVASLAAEGTVTPILGHGLTDSLIGSAAAMAEALAKEFRFPLARHLRDHLPQVSQFGAVSQGRQVFLKSRSRYVEAKLRAAAGDRVPAGRPTLDELFQAAWDNRDRSAPDPHELLAGFNCPVYVTTHPAQLLEHALRNADPPKDPVTAVCRWRPDDSDDNWPPSPFEPTAGQPFRPTPERPLVFHVFGLLEYPKTLVLTEDDYFKFLTGVAGQRDKVVPAQVRRALADSALLVLGFGLDDWDFRTLWQAIVRQEGSGLADDYYTHIAAQVDPTRNAVDPAAARAYLSKTVASGPPKLEIFWGSIKSFTSGVAAEMQRVTA